jgi:hypothetical protein
MFTKFEACPNLLIDMRVGGRDGLPTAGESHLVVALECDRCGERSTAAVGERTLVDSIQMETIGDLGRDEHQRGAITRGRREFRRHGDFRIAFATEGTRPAKVVGKLKLRSGQ